MPASQTWNDHLARVIETLKTPDFPATLVAGLQALVPFDDTVMFAYRGDGPPLDLFDDFSTKRRKIFVAMYQEGPFLLDPFYLACRNQISPGLYRLRDLAPDRFYQSEYFRSYYIKTGLSEEIGFIVPLAGDIRAVISLMRSERHPKFTEKEMNKLRTIEPVVRAAVTQNWENLLPRKSKKSGGAEHEILERYLDFTFRNFGRTVLTPRECEVVTHVLRGHSSDSISRILKISPGTVKIHRKNIYSKLGISSQSELFSLFISSLSKSSLPNAMEQSG